MLTKTLTKLAEAAIELNPDVAFVNLESSDQGDYLTLGWEPLTLLDGTQVSWEKLEKDDGYSDAEYAAGDISWDDAGYLGSTVPSWQVIDRRAGHYRFAPRAFLADAESELLKAQTRYSVTLSWAAVDHTAAQTQLDALTTAMNSDDVLPTYKDLAWSEIEEVR